MNKRVLTREEQTQQASDLRWVATLIAKAQQSRLHGKLEVTFQDGMVTRAHTQESHLPPRAEEQRGGNGNGS